MVGLLKEHLDKRQDAQSALDLPDPVVPPLTAKDTSLFPSNYVSGLVAYSSAWIDLSSPDPVIASISRQVLNLEVAYANFCGVRSLIIPGPRQDACQSGHGQGIDQFGRAVQEALVIASRLNIIIHLPMYREPGLEEKMETLSALVAPAKGVESGAPKHIDLFGTWDSWHRIRTICSYNSRLSVAIRFPRMMPERELQERWFSEPLHYLTFGPQTFQLNKAGQPSLSKAHQGMINECLRLRNPPWLILYDVGPDLSLPAADSVVVDEKQSGFPTLEEAQMLTGKESASTRGAAQEHNAHLLYLRYLERQQEPFSYLERTCLTNFQDWLQSPLQPLSDNLESATYEMFEGDPVKYERYEAAATQALADWSRLRKPVSSPHGAVVVAVAGSGRGPLVTRVLRASEVTGVPVEVWAVEKNPNAYVYLLRMNETEWGGCVHVVKTDMRAWKGPLLPDDGSGQQRHGKVDILVSELLGSFGDNELSPECLDGIQHVLAHPHGISIPASYTSHVTPIATPRLHAEIASRIPTDPHSFETPWVVRLYAIDFVASRNVPDHPRFQQTWEFVHPIPESTLAVSESRRAGGVVGGGGGSMAGAVGVNDHNSRHAHLTFVCRCRGVVHGLAGYFESVLYASDDPQQEKVELSILPDEIDRKSKDMISWFPIFFPLKVRSTHTTPADNG